MSKIVLKRLHLPDESATRQLGAALGALLHAGDVVALQGDLGAGKTTLARGLIQAAMGKEDPVLSPTFTMVQTYGEGRSSPMIWHFDLYRTSHPEELAELGWEDALAEGISLVEWPERAADALPEDTLWLTLEEEGGGRQATFAGPAEWAERLAASGIA